MSQIRPVSDLRNSFADISRTVHETREPVILTKNGYGDMVVMSYEEYQSIQYEMGVTRELRAAELESETTTERYTHDDVMAVLAQRLPIAFIPEQLLIPSMRDDVIHNRCRCNDACLQALSAQRISP